PVPAHSAARRRVDHAEEDVRHHGAVRRRQGLHVPLARHAGGQDPGGADRGADRRRARRALRPRPRTYQRDLGGRLRRRGRAVAAPGRAGALVRRGMKRPEPRSHCPISSALDIFGDKWSLLVMRDLLFRNKAHYREFLASEEGIATNILADRLARLEAAGLIERTGEDPRSGKQAYLATAKGQDLIPLLLQV